MDGRMCWEKMPATGDNNKKCGLDYMRVAILIALFIGGTAYANPVVVLRDSMVVLRDLKIYIDSEKLTVIISPTNATFNATFTFAFAPSTSDVNRASSPSARVTLPLWLPESRSGDPFLEKFWKGFKRHGYEVWCDNPRDEGAFVQAIA